MAIRGRGDNGNTITPLTAFAQFAIANTLYSSNNGALDLCQPLRKLAAPDCCLRTSAHEVGEPCLIARGNMHPIRMAVVVIHSMALGLIVCPWRFQLAGQQNQ